MVYTKLNWQNSPSTVTPVNAENLNHLETQYDEAKAYADTKFASLPISSTSQRGIVELATNAETLAGTDAVRAVTPAGVKAVVDSLPGGTADPRSVNPATYGVPTNGTTSANASFQTMLNSLPSGAVVEALPGQRFNFNGPVNLSKPVTIRGGEFLANTTGATFIFDADDVTLDSLTITGPGASNGVVLEQYFIMSTGSASKLIRRGRILNCKMTGCQSSFIWLDWMADFLIEGNNISDGQYSGIMMISPKQGVIRDNTVRTLRQGGSLVNSYGIAVTDILNTAAARAENVLIDGNYVADVPGWKGIDTHGGKGIQATNNRIYGCRTGISFTTGNDNRLMPPEDCYIGGNFIDRGTISNQNAAIVLNGKTGGPYPDRFATGGIGVNVINGYTVDLDLQYYIRAKVITQPQVHNGSTRRSPEQQAFRTYAALTSISKSAGTAVGTQVVNFPAGMFSAPPIVSVTKASGAGAAFIPYADAITANSVTVSVYHASGATTGDYTIPINLIAMQTGGLGNGATYA